MICQTLFDMKLSADSDYPVSFSPFDFPLVSMLR